MKMREHPAKYYKKKKARKYNSDKIRKSKDYKKYKKHHKKHKKHREEESSGFSILGIVVGVLDIACDTGVVEAIFGKKGKHGVRFAQRLLQVMI